MDFVLHMKDDTTLVVSNKTGRIEIRGHTPYGVVHCPNDPLHIFLDSLDPATVSVLMTEAALRTNKNNTRQEPTRAACQNLFDLNA